MAIFLLLVMVLAMYGIFQILFGSSKEITVIEEIPSTPKDLKEVMDQMQSEKLFKQAISLTEQNNYTEALPILEQAANLGNAEAMCTLGELYAEGKVVANDIQKSYEYYSQAAQKEHPQAQYQLGMCFLGGKGVSTDMQQAQQWIEKAAQNGYPEALEVLKRMGIPVTPIRKPEITTSGETPENTSTRGILSNVFVCSILLGITLWVVFFLLGLEVFKGNFYNAHQDREEAAALGAVVAIFGIIAGGISMIIAYFKPKISSIVYAITLFVSIWLPTLLIYFVKDYFSSMDRTVEFWGLTFIYIIALIIMGLFIKLSKSKKPIIKF